MGAAAAAAAAVAVAATSPPPSARGLFDPALTCTGGSAACTGAPPAADPVVPFRGPSEALVTVKPGGGDANAAAAAEPSSKQTSADRERSVTAATGP